MKQTDNRQKELKQLKAQKSHWHSFRDKFHGRTETAHTPKSGEKKDQANPEVSPSIPPPAPHPKIGRNDPCPCGSGKKYKKCCLDKK